MSPNTGLPGMGVPDGVVDGVVVGVVDGVVVGVVDGVVVGSVVEPVGATARALVASRQTATRSVSMTVRTFFLDMLFFLH